MSAILVLPLFLCEVPPLGDYPNHLARAFVLASLPHDPVLARFYAPNWSVIPNLGLDLLMPPLIRVLPVHVVGRLMIGLAVLLTFLGSVAYSRALEHFQPDRKCSSVATSGLWADSPELAGCKRQDRTTSPLFASRFTRLGTASASSQPRSAPGQAEGRWWCLGAGLAAWNSCLLYGFLNFSLSLGLALLLAAAWLRWRDRRPILTVSLAVTGALALFACHLMGLLFFALLAGSAELVALWRSAGRGFVRRAGALLLVLGAPAGLYAGSALEGMGGDGQWISLHNKLLQLVTTFTNFDPWLDNGAAAAAILVPVVSLVLRRGCFPAPAAVAVLLLLAVYAAAPFGWKGTWLLDTRLSTMLGLMMFAGFVPLGWPSSARIAGGVAVSVLFALRIGVLTYGFLVHNTVTEQLRVALAPVQPGQTVFVADAGFDEAPAYWAADPYWLKLSNGVPLSRHLGALALIERHAWWPFEFDIPSQQPIRTLPPYAELAARTDSLPDVQGALKMDMCGFDFVLVTDAEAVPKLPSERFRLIKDAGFAALYAVTACRPSG